MPSSTRATSVAAVALLAAFAAQCLGAMRLQSATFDEPAYVAAAWTSTTTDVDTNAAHPPLMKYLMAVPLALVGPSPASETPLWSEALAKPRSFGASFLFENRADPDAMLFAARSAVLVLSLLLGALVAVWAQRLYGAPAGLVALGLYAFCPNLLAHSSLATLDLGVTAGVAAASYALWRAYRQPSWRSGAVAGVALGFALLMKATALLLVALLPLELAMAVLWHRRAAVATATTSRRKKTGTPASRTPALLLATAVALVAVLGVLEAGYGLGRFAEAFRDGVLNRAAYMKRDYQTFLWGRYSTDGFRWYFAAAFLLKTPIPTLVATLALPLWLARRWPRVFDEAFLALPVVAFFVATAFTRDDLGLRYLLPIYPLLYVLIAGMTVEIARTVRARATAHPWRSRFAAVGGGVATLAYVGGTLATAPHHLAFFNGLVCGPGDGIRYLDDSNVDWGQDYKLLVRWLRERGIRDAKGLYHPYHLAPFVARYYGLALQPPTWAEIRRPTPGWYAISAHLLQRPALAHDPEHGPVRFDWLDRFTPVAKIGYSIYVYRFE